MKLYIKKSLLSEDEESAEKKKSGFKGGSEPLNFFSLRISDLAMGTYSFGEGYWSAVTFSPDLSPLCALLVVMKMEEAGASFPAVDSILVKRALESEEGSFRMERFQIHSTQKQGGRLR